MNQPLTSEQRQARNISEIAEAVAEVYSDIPARPMPIVERHEQAHAQQFDIHDGWEAVEAALTPTQWQQLTARVVPLAALVLPFVLMAVMMGVA